MLWSHQIVHYLQMGHFDKKYFFIGILLSLFFIYLMKNQVGKIKQNMAKKNVL